MDKTTLVIAGLCINAVLLAGMVYRYFFWSASSHARQPVTALERQRTTTKRIAIIMPNSDATCAEVRDGIINTFEREATFTPDIKVYDANGSRTLLRSSIEDAVEQNFDILMPIGSEPSQMTKEVTEKRSQLIPIAFCGTGDPIKLGLIQSPERSGNHLTGVCIIGVDWIDRMVDMLKVLMPGMKKVLMPYNPMDLGGMLEEYKQHFDRAFKRNNIETESVKVHEVSEVIHHTKPFIEQCDAIMILPSATLLDAFSGIAKLCHQYQKGIVSASNLSLVPLGCPVAYGYRVYDVGVEAARSARKILEDNLHPSDVPTNPLLNAFKMVVSSQNAEKLGCMNLIDQQVLYFMKNGDVI